MTGTAGVLNSLAFQMFSYDKGTRFSDGRLLCSRRVGRSEVGGLPLASLIREGAAVCCPGSGFPSAAVNRDTLCFFCYGHLVVMQDEGRADAREL